MTPKVEGRVLPQLFGCARIDHLRERLTEGGVDVDGGRVRLGRNPGGALNDDVEALRRLLRPRHVAGEDALQEEDCPELRRGVDVDAGGDDGLRRLAGLPEVELTVPVTSWKATTVPMAACPRPPLPPSSSIAAAGGGWVSGSTKEVGRVVPYMTALETAIACDVMWELELGVTAAGQTGPPAGSSGSCGTGSPMPVTGATPPLPWEPTQDGSHSA